MDTISDVVKAIEAFAPPALQESYDNAGLIIGDPNEEVRGVLICLDVTEKIIEEAISKKCNLIVAHHPLIFSGIKKLNGKNYTERTIIKAIKNGIAVFAAHTNLDHVNNGVNKRIADKLGLKNTRILSPLKGKLQKIVVFCPVDHAQKVREAMFSAGAGQIGNYDKCSYNVNGEGTFRAGEGSDPFVGKEGELHTETETRFELIYPSYLKSNVIKAVLESHPYEEPAYDVYSLENEFDKVGAGIIGDIASPMGEQDFLLLVKEKMKAKGIRYTKGIGKPIKTVAICGGSGSFLLDKAIAAKADIFITGDFKYHQFFDAEDKIMIADIGHYESEQYTGELFYEVISNKFPKFAVHLTEINTNPINYL